jgi:23S rRNA pseudouridine2605 synthase
LVPPRRGRSRERTVGRVGRSVDEARASSEGERLQKLLARLGVASRRGVEALIREGRVSVNDRPAELGMRVLPDDRIAVDGKLVTGEAKPVTLMLNKPPGVVTTASDERGRRTVMDLLPRIPGLHPIGRLDMQSEGLLLLTTDGELTLRLSHPRYGHRKSYRVWCRQGALPATVLERLRQGIELEDGQARAEEAEPRQGGCLLVLSEGRKRQVRRMLGAVGFDVSRLQRVAIGTLELGRLAPGEWRELSPSEIDQALAGGR